MNGRKITRATSLFNNIPKRKIIPMLTDEEFNTLIEIEIDKLGGGYFDQSMFEDGRLNPVNKPIYAISGETMYDIDRLNGGTINTCPDGIKFWHIIDTAVPSKKTWVWNHKGENLAPKLKACIPGMIRPKYESWCKKYLTEDSLFFVQKSKKITFHFFYAVYNGSGWFKNFATVFNKQVALGLNMEQLEVFALACRTENSNALIRQGGIEMIEIFKMPFLNE